MTLLSHTWCMPSLDLTSALFAGPYASFATELGALNDYVHPRQVLKLAGMNLVEKSSGQLQSRRRQSKRGRPLLRKQLYLLAIHWCKSRGLYRDQYLALVARNGGSKVKAISALARKLVPLLLEVAQSAQPFDHGRWENERRRRCI